MPGDLVDRVGPETGRYVSPAGTPIEARSLPLETRDVVPNVYRVAKPFEAWRSVVAPWHGEPGLGIQYRLPLAVGSLIKRGILEPVER